MPQRYLVDVVSDAHRTAVENNLSYIEGIVYNNISYIDEKLGYDYFINDEKHKPSRRNKPWR